MLVTEANLKLVKAKIREDIMPVFTDEELSGMLEMADSIDSVCYDCLIQKAEPTTVNLSGLSVADMSPYFLRLASLYRPSNSGVIEG